MPRSHDQPLLMLLTCNGFKDHNDSVCFLTLGSRHDDIPIHYVVRVAAGSVTGLNRISRCHEFSIGGFHYFTRSNEVHIHHGIPPDPTAVPLERRLDHIPNISKSTSRDSVDIPARPMRKHSQTIILDCQFRPGADSIPAKGYIRSKSPDDFQLPLCTLYKKLVVRLAKINRNSSCSKHVTFVERYRFIS